MEPTYYIFKVTYFWGKTYWTGDFVVAPGHGQWAIPQAVIDQKNMGGKACVARNLWHSNSNIDVHEEIGRIKAAFPELADAEFGYCEYEDLPQGEPSVPTEADKTKGE